MGATVALDIQADEVVEDCRTVVKLALPEADAGEIGDAGVGAVIVHLKPRESRAVRMDFRFRWSGVPAGSDSDLTFQWAVAPGAGTAAPTAGTILVGRDELDRFMQEIRFSYTAPATSGAYPLSITVNADAAASPAMPAACRSDRYDYTVIVDAGHAASTEYGVSIAGQYVEPGGARAGLVVRGAFGVDSRGKIRGHATHENWILGECVQYHDSMPQAVDGWVEGGRIRLRFNKAGEATATTDNIDDENPKCLFKGLQELGTLLAMIGSDAARQAGDPRTSTAVLPGGLRVPGEVTFPVIQPGGADTQAVGNLHYSIRRRE